MQDRLHAAKNGTVSYVDLNLGVVAGGELQFDSGSAVGAERGRAN